MNPEIRRKLIIGSAISVSALVVVTAAVKLAQRAKHKEQQKDVFLENKSELDTSINSGMKPSWPAAEYERGADALQEYMNGCGTYEQKIVDAFKKNIKNDTDFLMLKNAWGYRTVKGCAAYLAIPWFGWALTGGEDADLETALKSELNEEWIALINNGLRSNNVTKRI